MAENGDEKDDYSRETGRRVADRKEKTLRVRRDRSKAATGIAAAKQPATRLFIQSTHSSDTHIQFADRRSIQFDCNRGVSATRRDRIQLSISSSTDSAE